MEIQILSIREARESDLPSVCRLSDDINMDHHENMPRDFIKPDGSDHDDPYWRRFLGKEGAAVFVAEDGGALVGVVAVSVSKSAPFPFIVSRPRGHVATIVVAKKHRGKGIGHKLISTAEAFAKNEGADDIRLEVMAFNADALEFYREIGYENFSYRLSKPLP